MLTDAYVGHVKSNTQTEAVAAICLQKWDVPSLSLPLLPILHSPSSLLLISLLPPGVRPIRPNPAKSSGAL